MRLILILLLKSRLNCSTCKAREKKRPLKHVIRHLACLKRLDYLIVPHEMGSGDNSKLAKKWQSCPNFSSGIKDSATRAKKSDLDLCNHNEASGMDSFASVHENDFSKGAW